MTNSALRNAKVHLNLSFDEVAWIHVLELLSTRHKLNFRSANALLNRFQKRFLSIGNMHWFISPSLDPDENMLSSAIGECLGADIINMTYIKRLGLGPWKIDCKQTVRFEPNFRRSIEGPSGVKTATLKVRCGRYFVLITKSWQLFLLQAVVAFLGALSTAAMLGLALYGISVLIVFVQSPFALTSVAFSNFRLWLALLCVLVGLAGLFGRLAKSLMFYRKPSKMHKE